jgi:hypothetical protein
MAIKEIRKIESNIKEVKVEKKKVESIDDEFEEEEHIKQFSFKRSNKTSTLDATEVAQERVEERQNRVSKEDREEINFRPNYLGGANPYQGNSYTPVGQSETQGRAKGFEENQFGRERENGLNQNRNGNTQERNYLNENNQDREHQRKRNLR